MRRRVRSQSVNRSSLTIFVFLFALILAACGGADDTAADDPGETEAVTGEEDSDPSAEDAAADDLEPFKIGVTLEITGEGASLGVPMRDAINLALAQRGGQAADGRPIEVIILDNQSAEDRSAQTVTRLIEQEEVDILIGPGRSGDALAVRAIAERAEIPMIALGANTRIVEDSDWVFKTVVNTPDVLGVMVDLAAENGWDTLAVLRDASGFGEHVAEDLAALAEPHGIEVIAEERFEPTTTDFTAHMVSLRSAGADANVLWGIPPAIALAQVAYDELDVGAPVMHSHGIGNPVFIETAGTAAEGVLSALGRLLVFDQLPDDEPQLEVISQFVADYQDEYGIVPPSFAGNAYDAFNIAIDALEAVGSDRTAIRDYVQNLDGFVGVTGVYSFSPENHSGLAKDAMAIVTVQGGQFVLVDNNR